MRGAEAFQDLFQAARQVAIAKQKAKPAEGKMPLVSHYDAVRHESEAGALVPPMPRVALRENAELEGATYLRAREGFVEAIAASETPEDARL